MYPKIDYVGPTGRIVRGHVLDADKAALERCLQDYDRQLYLSWNPSRRGGWGMWQVRRRPERFTQEIVGVMDGATLIDCKYQELDIINHVLDVERLSWDIPAKIKKMDRWGVKDYAKKLEESEAAYRAAAEARSREDLRYAVKEEKKLIRQLREELLSGLNPHQVLARMGKSGS